MMRRTEVMKIGESHPGHTELGEVVVVCPCMAKVQPLHHSEADRIHQRIALVLIQMDDLTGVSFIPLGHT